MSTSSKNIHYKEILCELGLTSPEADIYLASLQLGRGSAAEIAKASGLKRGHTYKIVNALVTKGLLSEQDNKGVKQFIASSPRNVLSMLEQRVKALMLTRGRLNEAVTEIERSGLVLRNKLNAKVFDDFKGFKELFENVLRTGEDMYGVADGDSFYVSTTPGTPEFEWEQEYLQRRNSKQMCYYGIFNKTAASDEVIASRPMVQKQMKMVSGVNIGVEFLTFGPNVAVISNQQGVSGVVLENEQLAKTLRSMHQAIWHFLPDYTFGGDLQVTDRTNLAAVPKVTYRPEPLAKVANS